MKRRAELAEELQQLSSRIETQLFELEKQQIENEKIHNGLLEDATELAHLSVHAPAYVRERALRLQALLKQIHQEIGYSQSRYHSLHRQIAKINDLTTSDLLSPYLQDRLDQIAQRRDPDLRKASGRMLVFRLGDSLFAVTGTFYRLLHNLYMSDRERIRPANSEASLEFFPASHETHFLDPYEERALDLLLLRRNLGRSYIGFWLDEVIEIADFDPEKLHSKLHPLAVEHPLVKGRFKRGGRMVNWIDARSGSS